MNIDPIGDATAAATAAAVGKIQPAVSQIIKDTIGQIANVLVPAVADAAKGAISGVTVTVEPIVIRLELK